MKNIPNIKLNKEQLYELLLWKKVFTGGEATICESNNPNTLYKIFWSFNNREPMCDNKIKKIELLFKMQLEHSVIPVSTISFDDMIIGYEMTTDYDFHAYNLCQLNKDELIYFLNKTKNILEYYKSMGVIYADIAPRNILFNRNNGEIQFCDIDNVQIGDYKIDIIPHSLIEYDKVRGIDYDVHPYMHNIMTMEAYNLYLYYCSNWKINKLFYSPGKKIIYSLENPERFDGSYLIMHKKKK